MEFCHAFNKTRKCCTRRDDRPIYFVAQPTNALYLSRIVQLAKSKRFWLLHYCFSLFQVCFGKIRAKKYHSWIQNSRLRRIRTRLFTYVPMKNWLSTLIYVFLSFFIGLKWPMDTIHTASFDAEKVMVLEFRSISIRFKNSSKRSRS